MIRRSSDRKHRRNTAPTPPGQNLGICRYRTRSHESAAPPHITSKRVCNGTDTPTLRIIAPTSPPARLISARYDDPRRHGGVDVLRSRVLPPLRLQAGAARGRRHNGLLVTTDLRELTATRPVTTPNSHLRRLAQSPPTTTTRHTMKGVCSTPHTKKNTPRPQTAHRGQGSIATTRATCDVRAELWLVHWAWRGRDSPAPQEHDGGLGSYFFVGRVHAPPPSAWLSPRPRFPSRVSFMRAFFASCFGFMRRPAACAVYVADRPRGMTPDAASERRWRRDASLPPIL